MIIMGDKVSYFSFLKYILKKYVCYMVVFFYCNYVYVQIKPFQKKFFLFLHQNPSSNDHPRYSSHYFKIYNLNPNQMLQWSILVWPILFCTHARRLMSLVCRDALHGYAEVPFPPMLRLPWSWGIDESFFCHKNRKLQTLTLLSWVIIFFFKFIYL